MNSAFKPKIIDYISGIFILVTIIGFIYILYASYTKNVNKQYDYYYTYFDSSYGVSKNAFIFYLEIPIGTIKSISFSKQNKVKIEFGIEHKYLNLITEGSKIEVLSSLGVGSLLNGKGLQLTRSTSTNVIAPNSMIESVVPQSMGDIIEQFELDKLSVSLKSIVYNIEKLLTTINDKDGDFMKTLSNINKITKQTVNSDIPSSIVKLSTNIQLNTDEIINNLSNSILQVDKILNSSNEKINDINIKRVNEILDSIKTLVQKLNITAATSNNVLKTNKDKINNIMLRTDNITKTINEYTIFNKDEKSIQELDIR